jgi:glucoamylase
MDDNSNTYAPGWPGITPRWTSSAKSGVGTALQTASRVWFTLSHGIIDEVYYGRVDWACTRDMGLLVSDGHDYLSEEKRDAQHEVSFLAPGVPAYCLINTDLAGRYRIEKEILADPRRSVILQRTRFVPLQGKLEDYHVYVLLAPHLGNHGRGNTAYLGDTKGTPMLFAKREATALALGSSAPWLKRSVGFAGRSDAWVDLMQHKQMTWEYERAENGNVAVAGEIDLAACGGSFLLALGFSQQPLEAGHYVRASLADGFDTACQQFIAHWQGWQQGLLTLGDETGDRLDEYRISAMVLRAHEAKAFPGGIIASLSIPWGFAKGDDDLGGYHLVWARDLVETVGGLMAAGAKGDAGRVLRYLQVTQEADGHWTQNMWLDGTPYWTGVQIDETAFPILLTAMAWREGLLNEDLLSSFWPMVRQAASYVVRNGPVTQQDRWEEDAGYSPFTLAVEIAALLAAADLAELAKEPTAAAYLRETADTWNAHIERWTYIQDTDLARVHGVDGYYVRIAPPDVGEGASLRQGYVPIKNRPPGQIDLPATQIISPDALALVRFGLRAADDPRILNTVKVIDATLKLDTPKGPIWHRYNDDGYGEKADGAPYDGTGIGRAWPLLVGERAHYELAAGRFDEAERLRRTMAAFANRGGMIPEQIWDAPDIPDRELFFGQPSGSAMPLVWAHAEYVKLCRSLRERRVIDMPPQPFERYLVKHTGSDRGFWRFNQKIRTLPAGQTLRIEALAPATVHWSSDGWQTAHDDATRDTTLGVHLVDLPVQDLQPGAHITFTFDWPQAGHWEGANYDVLVTDGAG